MPWKTITNCGDLAVTLPMAMAIAVWLVCNREHAAARCWTLLFAGATALVALSKIGFAAWGLRIAALDLTCISGHTMLATAVFPVALHLALTPLQPRASRLFLVAGWCLAALVGYSRLALNAHSPAEVLAGFACGLIVSALFFAKHPAPAYGKARAAVLLLALATVLGLQHGSRTAAPAIINSIALKLTDQPTLHVRPKRI